MPASHDAFISYSHAADGRLAPAVERGLQRLAKPWHRLRAMSVFRDQSDLAVNPALWHTIRGALDSTRYFILLACPESAASVWVNREVAHWCDTKGTDRLLLVLTGGELVWDAATGEFATDSTAVPAALRGRFSEEPLYLDLRWAREVPELSLRLSRFGAAIAQLAAPIHGRPPDELEGEDIRLHRRARTLARTAIATVIVLAVVAMVAAVIAVGNARRADRRAREALGRQLSLAALDLPAGEIDQAFLLSLAAADLHGGDDADRFRASRAMIGRYSRLVALLHPSDGGSSGVSFRGVAIAPDGGRIVATAWSADGSHRLLAWDASRQADRSTVDVSVGHAPSLGFIGATGRLVIGAAGGQVSMLTEATVTPLGDVVGLDRAAGRALVRDRGGSVDLVDLGNATPVPLATVMAGSADPDDAVLADLSATRVAVASSSRIVLSEAGDGTQLASALVTPAQVSLAVGPTDDVAVLGAAADGSIRTWSRSGGSLVAAAPITAPEALGRPRQLVPSPDGRRVLVTGDAGSALVDLTTGAAASVELGATGLVVVDPARHYVAVGGARLTVWDLSTGQRTFAVPEPANALAWSGACDRVPACRLVSAGESLDVWDPALGRRVQLADQTNAQAVAISSDGSTVATAGWGDTIAVWGLTAPVDDTSRTELAPAGRVTAVDPARRTVARFDGASSVDVAVDGGTTRVRTGAVTALALAADSSRLVVDGAAGVRLFSVDDGRTVELDSRCGGDLFVVSPGGTYVLTYRISDGAAVVCDAGTGAMYAGSRITGAAQPVGAIAVDDDGSIALGGGDGYVEHYRADSGRFVTGTAVDVRFGGEPVAVTSVALRDGTIAAGLRPTSGRAAVARVLLWDAAGGGTPTQFDTDHRAVSAVGLLGPDAELVVVAGHDAAGGHSTLQVWEVDTRRRIGRAFGGLAGEVVMVGGDVTSLVGVDTAGRALRWSLENDPTAEICAIVGRPLRPDEWESIAAGALGTQQYSPACT